MNVFELLASLKLDKDGYEQGLSSAEATAKKVGGGIGKVFGGMAKTVMAGVAVSATAIAGLTKQAVDAYADYEQLVGGVETLFGTQGMNLVEYAHSVGKTTGEVKEEYFSMQRAQETVLANAADAYKTAGLSANEYMETVTSFAAALNSSLGGNTEEAAKKADLAITDMSDNANKMGSSMESIQNAYNGFAKGNFTMLDNLKIGYGGTKEEMQRLLTDAQKLSGIKYDISSYADIVDAIHVVQTEMGITGTTAKEATSTITGSLNMTKSAWQNLIAGIGNNDADMDKLVTDLVDSASHVFENILPIAEQALDGIGQMVEKIAPIISEKLPTLIETVLPILLDATQSLVNSLITVLPDLLTTIIMAIVDNIDMFVDMIIQLTIAIAVALTEALPILLEKLPEIIAKIVEALKENWPALKEAGINLLKALGEGIVAMMANIGKYGKEIVDKIKAGFSAKVNEAKTWGKDLIQNFIDGLMAKWEKLKETVSNIAGSIKDFLGFSEPKKGPLSNFHTYAPDMMDLFAQGIRENESVVTNQIRKSFDFGQIGTFSTSPIAGDGVAGFGGGSGMVLNQTINVNDKIATADELAQAVRIESRYGLMRGVALG